jgi:hypothetical protein
MISSSGNLKPSLQPSHSASRDYGVKRDEISFEITKCNQCKAELINGVNHECALTNELFGEDDRFGNQWDRKRPASPPLYDIGSGYKRFTRDNNATDELIYDDDPIVVDDSEEEQVDTLEDLGFEGDLRKGSCHFLTLDPIKMAKFQAQFADDGYKKSGKSYQELKDGGGSNFSGKWRGGEGRRRGGSKKRRGRK